ncbi:MAG: hypothetical protein V3V49_11000, partial [Candidatus Krumholzibacteria bacterium]
MQTRSDKATAPPRPPGKAGLIVLVIAAGWLQLFLQRFGPLGWLGWATPWLPLSLAVIAAVLIYR